MILGFLVVCKLRRAWLEALDVESLQMREGRWVLPNLLGNPSVSLSRPICGLVPSPT